MHHNQPQEKTAPTHSCLAHFSLCVIVMTSRIFFLGDVYPPPQTNASLPLSSGICLESDEKSLRRDNFIRCFSKILKFVG
jgi:hypothetical protein